MPDHLQVLRDTARFDKRQYYVDGYNAHWFTTAEDAQAAISLAGQVSINDRREMETEIRAAIDRACP